MTSKIYYCRHPEDGYTIQIIENQAGYTPLPFITQDVRDSLNADAGHTPEELRHALALSFRSH